MTDRLGNQLAVGMYVAYSEHDNSAIYLGKIKKINNVKVTIVPVDDNLIEYGTTITTKYPNNVIIIKK